MTVVLLLAWREVRLRWRAYAAIAALAGLTAGAAMVAVAGARRTQSSYPRLLRAAHASTMVVSDFGAFDPSIGPTIAGLPGVARSRTFVSFLVFELAGGRPVFQHFFEADGSKDGEYFDQDRFTPTHGRRPEPSRVDEVAVNELAAARYGYHVGQRLTFGAYGVAPTDTSFFIHPTPPGMTVTAEIVGVGAFPDETVQDEGDRLPRVLFTPAYTRQALPYATYGSVGLVLTHGNRDIPELQRRVAAVIPPGGVTFRVTAVDVEHALRAVRPLSVALGAFGGILGLAALLLVAQAIGRTIRSHADRLAVYRAIGAGPRAITGSTVLASAVPLVVGAALAVALAIGLSPLMPVGRVRRVEVRPGVAADLTVLGLGALVLIGGGVVAAAAYVVRERQRAGSSAKHRVTTATWAARLGVAAQTGVRFSVSSGDPDNRTSTRSVTAGVAVAVALLVGSAVFAASLVRLVDHPPLYGWNAHAVLFAGNGYGNIPPDVAHAVLDHDPDVRSWAGAYFGHGLVEGADLPILGMDEQSDVAPPITSGRFPTGPREAVLGGATARALHKRIGDDVTLVGPDGPHSLTVTGIATLPTIGLIHAAHTSLGEGMLVAHRLVPGYDRDITGQQRGDLGPRAIFIRYARGVSPVVAQAHLRTAVAHLIGIAGIDVLPVQLPAEITSSRSVTGLPVALAAALTFGMIVSLGLAIGSTVRRRRRDFAVLSALGFTRRQLARTVGWMAGAILALGLVVGMPLGVVLGRTAWRLFAGAMYVVDSPTVPLLVLVGVVAGGIVAAVLLSLVARPGTRREALAAALRAG